MKTPIHLWIVGVISLLWNAGGAYDYTMTQTRSAAYLDMLTAEQVDYIQSAPVWFDAFWAIGVWFGVIGSLLLLLRSRFAGGAFALSLLGLLGASIYSFGLAEPSALDIGGLFAGVFSAAIAVSLILFWLYARVMTRRGVLR